MRKNMGVDIIDLSGLRIHLAVRTSTTSLVLSTDKQSWILLERRKIRMMKKKRCAMRNIFSRSLIIDIMFNQESMM